MSETDRLRGLLDRLLSPRQVTHKQRSNIHQVLNKAVCLLSNEITQQVQIRRDYDPSLPELMLDSGQLMQVFLNIGRNALQAMMESYTEQPLLTITSRVVRRFSIGHKNHRLVCHISFRDNGPGINPQLGDEIFFPTVSGRHNGSGLGLSITQALVMQHQGLIEYGSQPGNTCFSIYLPMEHKA
jgi:two-component system nitrogen regulation sensor histidine kinase GlnL